MRKILLTVTLLSIVLIGIAQESAFDMKKFYIKGGYSLKGKNYYGLNDSQDKDNFKQMWDHFSLKAGNLEFGTLFFIEQFQFADRFRIGIDVNYLTVQFSTFAIKEDTLKTDFKRYNVQVGSAVGPVLSFQANKSLAFDLYFKLNPIWIVSEIEPSSKFKDHTTGFVGLEGMKYKIGANFRFEFLVLSVEFNPGSVIMQDYNVTGTYFGNIGQKLDYSSKLIEKEDLSRKTPLPMINFNLGFCF